MAKGTRPGAQTGAKRVKRLSLALGGFPERPGEPFTLPRAVPEPPPRPGWFVNSEPEWWCFWWLTASPRGPHWKDGQQFSYQQKVAGGRVPLGQVVDFIVYEGGKPLALPVDGLHWHGQSYSKLQTAEQQRRELLNLGFDVVIVWDDQLAAHLDFVMRQAIDFRREIRRVIEW